MEDEDADWVVRVEFTEFACSESLRGLSVTVSFNCINASVDEHEGHLIRLEKACVCGIGCNVWNSQVFTHRIIKKNYLYFKIGQK